MILDSSPNKLEKRDEQDRADKLSRAISYLDDDLIQEALETRRGHKPSSGQVRKWMMPMAACLLFAFVLVAAFTVSQRSKTGADSAFPEDEGNRGLMYGGTLSETGDPSRETADGGWVMQGQQTVPPQQGTMAVRPEDVEPSVSGGPTYDGSAGNEPGAPKDPSSGNFPEEVGTEAKQGEADETTGNPSIPNDCLHVGDSAAFYGGSFSFLSEDEVANTVTLLLAVDKFSHETYITFNTASGVTVATNNPAGTGYGSLAITVNGQVRGDGALPSTPGQYTVTVDYSWAVAKGGDKPASFTLSGSQPFYLSLTAP